MNLSPQTRARVDFGGYWKAMDIDSPSSQDLESFGKRKVSQNGCGRVLDFCLGKF